MTLGSHGDTMVPLPGRATIAGTPAEEVLDRETLAGAFERTRGGGAEIVALLQKGSAFYAPASATNAMVRAILEDRREVHPVCCYLTGQYGIDDVFVGVPAVLSRRGVEQVQELSCRRRSWPTCAPPPRRSGRSAPSWTRRSAWPAHDAPAASR